MKVIIYVFLYTHKQTFISYSYAGQVGYPCPNGMELTPAVSKFNQQLSAECKCPPKTAQSATDEKCYQLFTQGPCEKGNYFAPDVQYHQINNR